jgi:cell division protein DivIC
VRRGGLRAAVVGLVAIAVLAYGGSSLARVWQMRQDVERLEREISGLRAEQQEVRSIIDRLRSDPDAIEQAARELLGLVKPGEKVLKLPPSPSAAPVPGPRHGGN